MENLFLIVGLGNPGRQYARTRHNAGFMLAERLAGRWQARWELDRGLEARWAKVRRGERTVLLSQPQTFMNASGRAVAGLLNYHRVATEQLLVVVDDADLPLGKLRLRGEGSSGGHHGLGSVEASLGTRQYARLRIGIGRVADDRREIMDHVLSRFADDEAAALEKVLAHATDQVECWLEAGLKRAMDRYNGWIEDSNSETEE
jgi:peptidyl-tRNA hydrolase, PTH1 family